MPKIVSLRERLLELYEEARDENHRVGRQAFADQCGITIGQLDGYLQGNCEKLWETLRVIAKNNNVSVSWLLGETDDRVSSHIRLKEMLELLSPADFKTITDLTEFLYNKAKKQSENIHKE